MYYNTHTHAITELDQICLQYQKIEIDYLTY